LKNTITHKASNINDNKDIFNVCFFILI
jgi:hypothetical protein